VSASRANDSEAIAGLLLTGGASRRMGRDKASIVLGGGLTCAQTVARRLIEVADPTFEVGPGNSGLRAVLDESPGAGPLAALATGWRALNAIGYTGPALLLACDLPLMSVAVLELVAHIPDNNTIVPMVDGRPQPLCARYAPSTLDLCEGLVAQGERSLRTLLDVATVTWLDESVWSAVADARCFADIDTPEDVASLLGTEETWRLI
jgi:molybdopterin-guanine dinucleotide biosynthesis protein A